MILVIVRDHQIVDLFDAGVVGGGDDAVGIAIVKAVIAGIDQHGLTGGRNKQGRLAALHVDRVDLQIGRAGERS